MWVCPKCKREFDYNPRHHFCDSGATSISEYITGQAKDIQPRLWEVYHTIQAVLPDAREKISYRMPTFWKGRSLIHFAAFANWIGLYPGSEATTFFAEKLKMFYTTKGGIRFPHNEPLPLELITEIAILCSRKVAK